MNDYQIINFELISVNNMSKMNHISRSPLMLSS